MSSKWISNPAGVLTVPLGVVEVCHAGTSLTVPQSNLSVPPRLRSRTSTPSSPISPAISVIATTVAPVRLAIVDRVAEVVAMAVGEQDRGRRDVVGCDRGLWVASQERVDQHRRVAVGQLKAGVAEKSHFHRHPSSCVVGPGPEASSRASSNPTATPTSIPSRVSSASSV